MAANPFHIFSLSTPLVDTLIPHELATAAHQSEIKQETSEESPVPTTVASGSRSCNICQGISFLDVNEQRIHYRSDWHRYNVKLKLNNQDTVQEVHFNQLVDALEDSISGSASSSEDDEEDAVAALLSKNAHRHVRSSSPDAETPSLPKSPIIWFHSPPSTQIGVYRALFNPSPPAAPFLDQLKEMQQCDSPEGKKWALFMVAGGHFAGAVVRVGRQRHPDGIDGEEKAKKAKSKKPAPDTEILLHKTVHRYTTRRKQGGSQGLNDNAKGNAQSAGAMLRRYGEQALRDDIRELLQNWSEEINQCELIWIRASVSNRRIFYDYDKSVVTKGDERLRTFPFPTRRPTQSELNRCLMELTRVKMSHLTEDALRAQNEAFLASIPKPKPVPIAQQFKEKLVQPSVPKLTKEEEVLKDKWKRLLEMISKGRLETLKAFWEKEEQHLGTESGVDVRIPDLVSTSVGQTILQVASQEGQEEIVIWLLEDRKANPTLDMPLDIGDGEGDNGKRRTAYDVSSTREVRNVFRRCAGAYPDWWDWLGAARVPSVLSQEMEEQRDEKKKGRRKGLKDKIKEREAREKENPKEEEKHIVEEVVMRKETFHSSSRRLGGFAGDEESVAGLTPEMKATVERERRARAAEARIKALAR